jgi:serine/threonine-protein kinase
LVERDDHTIDATSSGATPAATGDLAIGDHFAERYVVEALIGRGGMGSVYRVRDTMVDEVVALKLLGMAGPDVLERFRREVRLARRITSPHVARTHDLGSYRGVHYLTMELVEGASLGHRLEKHGPMSPGKVARIGAAIAHGLAAAHAASVVHRDLKPDNVLLEQGGRVVVTDFGIARALEHERTRATGGIAGTPAYMAPEQLAGGDIDGRADLYALGVVLFEMLTGELPFEGDTPISIAVARLHRPPRDLASLRPVPQVLADMVAQLLVKERDQRVASAELAASKLEEAAAQIEASSGPSAPSTSALSVSGVSPSVITPSAASPSRTPSSTSGLRRTLAVLPLVYRGPAGFEHVPEGLADELVDLLARTRGMSTLGRTTTAKEAEKDRDPRALGRQLGATHVLDGTLQASGTRVRATVRLTDVATGVQVFSHKEELDAGDGFGLEERFARRIAEAVRLALEGIVGSDRISGEALDLYHSARKRARSPMVTDRVATVEALEQVIALAPSFAPALAMHALACVRALIAPRSASDRDWTETTNASLARALERAAHVPETHHAAAVFHSQQGHFRETARHARAALALAPAYPDAHLLLGQLKLEAGQAREGLEEIDVALDIEPGLVVGEYERARYQGLYGDLALYEPIVAKLLAANERVLWGQIEVRVGAWRGDPERIRRGMRTLEGSTHPIAAPLLNYARVCLREVPASEAFTQSATTFQFASPRVQSIALQMQAEALGIVGEVERSAECVGIAATTILVDLDWIDRCPAIDAVRARPEFPAWRRAVLTRCEEIWNA